MTDKELNDPMFDNTNTNCFKKHLRTIIFLLVGIVVITVVIVLVVVLTKKKGDGNGGNEDDTTVPDSDETEEEERQPEEEEHVEPAFDYGLELEELQRRTKPENLNTFILMTPTSEEYVNLDDGDKEALKYLVKAGDILERIQLRIDNINNIPFKNFLEEEIEKGVEKANLTKILFDGQKGINAMDALSNTIYLAKGLSARPGLGVYPDDITKDELHTILIKMLEEKKIDKVKTILNQRSIVERDGDELKATDYVDYFKEDFAKIADLFDEAANCSTNSDFNEYLTLQAAALRTANPLLDAYADIKWAELQDTPLELTITRENYKDELTGTIIENEKLKQLLEENNITVNSKDSLGLRVGIVNKEGTEKIISIKDYLHIMDEHMPHHEKYNSSSSDDGEIKQTMVDADLVMLAGDVGAYRAGITLAENLPNDDKLSLSMGGGRRNVYHRQMRASDPAKIQALIDAVLVEDQHQYYSTEANHWFVICHENTHSLGPRITNDNLGQYSHIIEENKADMGGIAFLDELEAAGYYTEEQKKKIIVTFIVDSFMREKPSLNQPHWVRSVMQNFYQFINGGYSIEDGKIRVNIDKVAENGYSMMEKIIQIQLDNDYQEAENYVKEYFIWSDEQILIGEKILKLKSALNGRLINELADKLLAEE